MVLKVIIQSTIACHSQPSVIRHIVALFQSVAVIYLRRRTSSATFGIDRLGLPLPDLAIDCIADLFKRDEHGVFVTLKQYFEGIGYETMTEEQLLGACRRLVFSKVNQELYRQYKEHDPDLHRIIRNIKDSVPRIPVIRIEARGGENVLVFGGQPEHLPTISPEILEAYLTEEISSRMTIRGILLTAAEIFASQDLYKRSYPLTGFALIVRAAFANLEVSADESAVENKSLTESEFRRFVSESVSRVSGQMKHGYVEKGKVSDGIYTSYFQSIGEILCAEYVLNDGDAVSYYDHLRSQMPDLSPEEYRNNHRTVLEYLAKLTRKDFLVQVRKELED